ncbi:MAG: hypothetical protein ACK5TR_00330 [Alphaproteobacteria bacterium]
MIKKSLFLSAIVSFWQCSAAMANDDHYQIQVDTNLFRVVPHKSQVTLRSVVMNELTTEGLLQAPSLTPTAAKVLSYFNLDGTHKTKPITTSKEIALYRGLFRGVLKDNTECLTFLETYFNFLSKSEHIRQWISSDQYDALQKARQEDDASVEAFDHSVARIKICAQASNSNIVTFLNLQMQEAQRIADITLEERGLMTQGRLGVPANEDDSEEKRREGFNTFNAKYSQVVQEITHRVKREASEKLAEHIWQQYDAESYDAFPVDFEKRVQAFVKHRKNLLRLNEEIADMEVENSKEREIYCLERLYVGALFLNALSHASDAKQALLREMSFQLQRFNPPLYDDMNMARFRVLEKGDDDSKNDYLESVRCFYDAILKDVRKTPFGDPQTVRETIGDMLLRTVLNERQDLEETLIDSFLSHYGRHVSPFMLELHTIALANPDNDGLIMDMYERLLAQAGHGTSQSRPSTLIVPAFKSVHDVAASSYYRQGHYQKACLANQRNFLAEFYDAECEAYLFACIFLCEKEYSKVQNICEALLACPKNAGSKKIRRWVKELYKEALQSLSASAREKKSAPGKKLLAVLTARQDKVLDGLSSSQKQTQKKKRKSKRRSPVSLKERPQEEAKSLSTSSKNDEAPQSPAQESLFSGNLSSTKEAPTNTLSLSDEEQMDVKKGPKVKTKGTADPTRAHAPEPARAPTGAVQPKPLIIEDVLKGGPLEIFHKLFVSLDGNVRSSAVQISLGEVETLMKALKQSYKKDKGKGSHAVTELEMGEMRREVITLARHAYLKPYQWKALRDAFVARGLYPRAMKDLLVSKGYVEEVAPGAH